jgi:fatty-acyl-CoA synthase
VLICAAVGAPDAYAGELPVAFASLKPGMRADEAELLAFVHARVDEPPARPKSVTILDAVPVTNVGKIFKPELRRRAAEDVVRAMVLTELGDLRGIGLESELDKAGTPSVTVTVEGSDGTDRRDRLQALLAPLPIPLSIGPGE